jgi:polysaccharide biosynthesis transport protein
MQEEPVAQNEISLREYLELLRRRKMVIIQTFLAALLIGIVVAFVTRPVYRSTGRLLVTAQSNQMLLQRAGEDPLSRLIESGSMLTLETQLEVLMTPELLSKAYSNAGMNLDDKRVKVAVSRAGDQVDIIDVSTEAHQATIAEGVTNNLMSLYIAQDTKWRTGDIDESIKYAISELNKAEKDWRDASIKLDNYQQRVKLTDYATQLQTSNSALAELQKKEDAFISDLSGLTASIAALNKELSKLPRTITNDKSETNVANRDLIKQEIIKQQAIYEANLQFFKPDHVKMKALQKQIDQLKADLAAQPENVVSKQVVTNPEVRIIEEKLHNLEAQRAGMVATLAGVRGQKQKAEADLRKMSSYQYTQAALKQAAEIAQNKHKMMSDKLDNLKLRKIALPKAVRELTRATINPTPVRPNRMLIIVMSAVAGMFLGVCFALLQEFLDDRVNAPDDARRVMGVPALGYIPRIEKSDQRLLTSEKGGGSLLESYRVLRSNVRFAAVGEPLNSIMVTSTAPGEGKSMTSCNLAIAMALDGKRVILVDADLRRPTVHEKFGMRNTPGLTNVLVGALPLDKALQDTEIENLQILASGPIPPNPAELLNSNAMIQVQEQLKQRAEVVIFDSPPCLSVADAQVMSSTVDGVIYVVQLGSTKKSALRHGHELLRQAQARVLGIVYNKLQVDNRRSDYYYGYYSYYHKAELPSKANGNGKKSNGSTEWETMTAQAKETGTPAAIGSSEETARKSSDREDRA